MNEYNLGAVEQIPPGEGREFEIEGRKVAVFHLRSGAVRAVQAECPHRAGPLADGITGDGAVVCPFHAWKFDLTTGKALTAVSGDACLEVYPTRLTPEGTITLTLLPAAKDCEQECTASF